MILVNTDSISETCILDQRSDLAPKSLDLAPISLSLDIKDSKKTDYNKYDENEERENGGHENEERENEEHENGGHENIKKQLHTSLSDDNITNSKNYGHYLLEKLPSNVRPSDSKISDFSINHLLGQGTYGDVYVCAKNNSHVDKNKNNNKEKNTYALKILNINKLKDIIKHTSLAQTITTEITILSISSHPNIVKMYEWFYDDNSIYLLMEHAPCTDLYEYTNKMCIPISSRRCVSYMEQLWNCMIFLRENNIIHRDIKPENILVFDQGETIKLADFGMSHIINDDNPAKIIIGTLYYISPEIVLQQGHDHKSDLWASGILFYEFLTGMIPHGHLIVSSEIMNSIVDNEIELTVSVESQFNMKCLSLIKEILNYNPNDRPTLEQCLLSLNKCKKLVKYVKPNLNQYYSNGEYKYTKYKTL